MLLYLVKSCSRFFALNLEVSCLVVTVLLSCQIRKRCDSKAEFGTQYLSEKKIETHGYKIINTHSSK